MKNLSDHFQIESGCFDYEVQQIMMLLDEIQMEKHEKENAIEPEESVEPEVSREQEVDALKMLMERDCLGDLPSDLSEMGYASPGDHGSLLYLTATSRKLINARPISLISTGNSSVGKSHGQKKTASLVPSSEVVSMAKMTSAALSNMKATLAGKLVVIDEVNGIANFELLRSVMSNGEANVATSLFRDGEWQVGSRRIDGHFALFTSTTNPAAMLDEDRNRFLVVHTVDSRARRREIIQQKVKREVAGEVRGEGAERLRLKWIAIQKVLPCAEVIIPPNLEGLVFKVVADAQVLRSVDMCFSLIKTIALHRMHHREKITRISADGTLSESIIAEKEDVELAERLLVQTKAKIEGLNLLQQDVFGGILELVKTKMKVLGVDRERITFTRREIREQLGMDNAPVSRTCQQLEDLEYILRVRGDGARSKFHYRLNSEINGVCNEQY